MRKFGISVASAICAMIGLSMAAEAQTCKSETVVATGRSALTLAGAKDNAVVAWRREVVAKYGAFWAEFDLARDKTVERCAHTNLRVFVVCEARGRPCTVGQSDRSPVLEFEPVACRSGDSRNCDPYVKAMQTKLVRKGCRTKIDGAAGPGTSAALKCFQQKAKLPATGELDLTTAQELNK